MTAPQFSTLTDSPLARQNTSIFLSYTKYYLPQTLLRIRNRIEPI